MKKVLLSAIAGFLSVAVVNAGQHAQEEQTEEAGYCPFSGVYIAAGIGGSFYKHKVDYAGSVSLKDGWGLAFDRIGGYRRVEITGVGGNNLKVEADGVDITDHAIKYLKDNGVNVKGNTISCKGIEINHSRFIGTLAFGGGKVFANNFYLGGEVVCDFGSSKAKDNIKMSAVSPSLGIRLGYYNRSMNTLFYTKIAASYVSTKLDVRSKYDKELAKILTGTDSLKVSKFAPAVALGVEKAFGNKLSARLETEYRFGSSKTFKGAHVDIVGGADDHHVGDFNVETKFKTSGWNVRALVAYNINGL